MPTTLQRAAGVEIHPFDPTTATRSEWARLQAYRRLRHEEDYPGEPPLPDADFERSLREVRPLFEWRRLLALRDGAIVGNLVLELRRQGSPDYEAHAPFIFAGGGVPRALRRQGVATALFGALEQLMVQSGKTMATFKAQLPEGNAFLRAIGAQLRLESVENRMPMDGLCWDELAKWRTAATSGPDDLAWEVHTGRVPFERLAALMAPFTALINEQPLGTLEMPRMRYQLAGYTSWYADMDRRGGEHFLVMLVRGDEVAAMSDASWDARFPDRVYQQLTAVAAPWRGRGLAKAVKAAMLDLVRQRHPEVRIVITTNAQANAPMLSINQRLGFAVHSQVVTYQASRETLAANLQEAAARRGGSERVRPLRPADGV